MGHRADRFRAAELAHLFIDPGADPQPFSIDEECQLIMIAVGEIDNSDGRPLSNRFLQDPAGPESFIIFMRSEYEDAVLCCERR